MTAKSLIQRSYVDAGGGNLALRVDLVSGDTITLSGVIHAILDAGNNVVGHVILDASSAVIGHVVVDSAGNVAVTSLPALPAGTNVIGHIIVDSGSVAVSSLPALPAGSNVIGHVIVDTLPALVAGEAHIGEVGGKTLFPRPTVTVDTAAYAAGDTIGGIITVTNAVRVSGGTGTINQIVLTDLANQKPALEIRFFESSPAAGTYTDNNATVLHATDQAVALGRITVLTSDWLTTGSIATCTLKNVGLGIKAASGTSVYMVITAGGTSAPDYVASTDFLALLCIFAD